jgi:hypothetical protein
MSVGNDAAKSEAVAAGADLSLGRLFAPAIRALRQNWRGLIIIQAVGLVIVGSYFLFAPVREALATVTAIKDRYGIYAATLATMISGGLLPEVLKWAARLDARTLRERWVDTRFACLFWIPCGAVTFCFYQLQSRLWGDAMDFATVAKKVLFDQLVFTVIWGIPVAQIAFSWKRLGYSLPAVWAEITSGIALRRTAQMLVMAWAFWFPMTSMIYSLPGSLQFAMFALALAGWNLLMVFVASEASE